MCSESNNSQGGVAKDRRSLHTRSLEIPTVSRNNGGCLLSSENICIESEFVPTAEHVWARSRCDLVPPTCAASAWSAKATLIAQFAPLGMFLMPPKDETLGMGSSGSYM